MPSEKPPKSSTLEKPTSSVNIEQGLQEIKVLKEKFETAFAEGRKTKDLAQAKQLKEEIEAKFAEIERSTLGKGKKEKKKRTAGELGPYLDEIKKEHEDFLKKTFEGWYGKERAEKTEQKPLLVSPKDLDYRTLSEDIDAKKSGEYLLDPELVNYVPADFETMEKEGKIKVLELAEFNGEPLHEVGKHLIEKYADTHHIPGIEFWKWVVNNPDKAPKTLKDGKVHFFFGGVLRDSDGPWCVAYAHWNGGEFDRAAGRLDGDWCSTYRVVLLEI